MPTPHNGNYMGLYINLINIWDIPSVILHDFLNINGQKKYSDLFNTIVFKFSRINFTHSSNW